MRKACCSHEKLCAGKQEAGNVKDPADMIEELKYGIAKVYLFGSFARGDYHENSDIDLRIEKGCLKGLIALGGFCEEVESALERSVDVLTTGSLEDDFLEKIKQDEVLLYAES